MPTINSAYIPKLLVAVLTTFSTVPMSQADTIHYRWNDDRGNPVHSDRPPSGGVDYEVISTSSGLKRYVAGSEGAVPAEVVPRPGNEFEQVDTWNNGDSKNATMCTQAQSNLASLTSGDKITVKDEDGQPRELTSAEKAIEIETAKAQISVYCDS